MHFNESQFWFLLAGHLPPVHFVGSAQFCALIEQGIHLNESTP